MATLIENCNSVASAAVEIDAAIRAKGGTTSGGLRAAAAAISALPSGGGGDIVLNRIGSGKYDITTDFPCHLWCRTSLETTSANTSILSIGCVGDDLSKWEAEGNLGKTDAKIHIYIRNDSVNLTVQPQINEGSNNWGSGEIYLFTPTWESGHGVQWPVEVTPSGDILIMGRRIEDMTMQDRSGSNVFARCLAAIRADMAATGRIHIATTQTANVRNITEVYRYA